MKKKKILPFKYLDFFYSDSAPWSSWSLRSIPSFLKKNISIDPICRSWE